MKTAFALQLFAAGVVSFPRGNERSSIESTETEDGTDGKGAFESRFEYGNSKPGCFGRAQATGTFPLALSEMFAHGRSSTESERGAFTGSCKRSNTLLPIAIPACSHPGG
jgi:hypothetical protein